MTTRLKSHTALQPPGATPRKIGLGCVTHFPNLDPIYDQNLRFPYPIYDLEK